MGIHAVLRNGVHEHVNGEPKYFVKVWDPHLKKQIGRRIVGLPLAKQVEADLKAEVAVPLELRTPTEEIRAALVRGSRVDKVDSDGLMTFTMWSEIYLERFASKPDGSPRPRSSVAKDRAILNAYLLPTLGPRSLLSIRLPELEDLVSGLTRQDGTPLAGSSKQTVVGVLKRVFKMAVRRGALTSDPTYAMTTAWGGVSQPRRGLKPLLHEVERLAKACEALLKGMGDLIRILAFTGMRFEELAGLQAEDIDWPQRIIRLKRIATYSGGRREERDIGKTSAAMRNIPIVDQAMLPLKRAVAVADEARRGKYFEKGPRWVAVGKRGRPLNYSTWRRNLNKAREATGISYTAHTLRHIAATLAIDSGMTKEDLAKMLGHTKADYTRLVYGHEFEREKSEVIARMSATIAAQIQYEENKARDEAQPRLRSVGDGESEQGAGGG